MSRLVSTLADGGVKVLRRLRAARAAAREWVWNLAAERAPSAGGGLIPLDLDATIVIAHSQKQDAAPTWKRTFDHHPLGAFIDHGPGGTGEAALITLRPGNAGSNTATDHITTARAALVQVPGHLRKQGLVRANSGGGTREFLTWITRRKFRYSIGFNLSDDICAAIGALPEHVWESAYDAEDQPRPDAWVAELTSLLDLGSWPNGMRVIVGKEHPHPSTQLRFTDVDGHRFTACVSGTWPGGGRSQLADLELRHRQRARCEDRIRGDKECGLCNLPLHGSAQNQLWLEIVAIALDLLAWMQILALADHLARRGRSNDSACACSPPLDASSEEDDDSDSPVPGPGRRSSPPRSTDSKPCPRPDGQLLAPTAPERNTIRAREPRPPDATAGPRR